MDGEARFDGLCEDLLARNRDLMPTKMMGMPSLKLKWVVVPNEQAQHWPALAETAIGA